MAATSRAEGLAQGVDHQGAGEVPGPVGVLGDGDAGSIAGPVEVILEVDQVPFSWWTTTGLARLWRRRAAAGSNGTGRAVPLLLWVTSSHRR